MTTTSGNTSIAIGSSSSASGSSSIAIGAMSTANRMYSVDKLIREMIREKKFEKMGKLKEYKSLRKLMR